MLLRRFCAFVVLLCLTEGVLSAQNVIDLLPGNQIANGTEIAGQVAIGATGIPTGFTNSNNQVNVSGGDVGGFFQLEVNLFGTEFAIDGTPIDLVLGEEFVISDRNVTLTGTLSDGSFIENSLNTTFGGFFSSEPDGVAAGARVTVTRVVEPVILGDVDRRPMPKLNRFFRFRA